MPPDSTGGCDMLVWIRPEAVTPMTTGRAAGQVIMIKNCPHAGWGTKECPPDFKVIHVPDKKASDLQELVLSYEEYYANTEEEAALELPPQTKRMARRKHRIDVGSLESEDNIAIMDTHAEKYHELPYDKFSAKTLDDSKHEVLSAIQEKRDTYQQQKWQVAKIRVGVINPPKDWETNKHLFDLMDTSAEEAQILATMG